MYKTRKHHIPALKSTSHYRHPYLRYAYHTSNYSKFVYDVTTGHMTLRFEIFGGKLPTGKEETCKFGQGIYTIV